MESFVELVKAIVWPVTLIWILYYFKNDLRSLLERINKLKYKEAEANFEREVSKAHAKAKEISKKTERKKLIAEVETRQELGARDQFYRIAQVSPRAAIVEAWRHLEEKIISFGPKYGLESKGYASEKQILEKLKGENKLDEEFLVLYAALRELRNRAAHRSEFSLSQESAEEYIDTLIELNEELESIYKSN